MSDHFFLAVPLPEPIALTLKQTSEQVAPYVRFKRWTDSRDFHLTLFFFGALDDAQRLTILNEIKRITEQFSPFSLTLSRVEGFGDPNRPRVLYASVKHSKTLMTIRERLGEPLGDHGIPIDHRTFHPHITLAKRWDEGMMHSQLQLENLMALSGTWKVTHVSLFKVCPGQLPQYQSVAEFPFLEK
ncbi:RNA 2',3'-cyclic phosphodiesterase [Sporolactobacillus kofuensis]|uniref:RNA 2',3'-cyclic phosphodiesterase n=1 Tax=Sporolactobacillus kofuensis TaxID=269672 RepID=A0ABW1WAR4_9BACL|nr:RNA 2',3'-cyclic phosphodiesterase [Sporolactobacillus kofuensis]MCO7175903.1 RNA 2',3'-cyclic phosphodiesterase [Sporolactobacillus kofuensis]